VAFLFPACFTVFFFQNNRTAYDVLAKTIVVQTPQNHRRWDCFVGEKNAIDKNRTKLFYLFTV